MKILMMSNTYLPHVGGVAKSVESFTAEYRKRGHRVVLVVPEFDGMPGKEVDVIRVPAIQNFNGSDFSLQLPIPGLVASVLSTFQPDIIHAHHPFLLGDTALLIAASQGAPLVFTHHTMYEQYTHYVPGDSPALQRFVVELSTGYANLCNGVIAPSASVAKVLVERGVEVPIKVIPTGVEIGNFVDGDGAAFRAGMNIPAEAVVVGHLGRLAPEKNLEFLSRAVIAFFKENPQSHFLVVGSGPSQRRIKALFKRHGLSRRLHLGGVLRGRQLADAYHSMDVFAFASKSETQGMVLAEAMAAGVPVVALDAPGVREIVVDKHNGRLLPTESIEDFVSALTWVVSLQCDRSASLKKALKDTAESYSMSRCADQALSFYESLLPKKRGNRHIESSMWSKALRMIQREWEIWANRAHAAGAIITNSPYKKSPR